MAQTKSTYLRSLAVTVFGAYVGVATIFAAEYLGLPFWLGFAAAAPLCILVGYIGEYWAIMSTQEKRRKYSAY